MNLIRKKASPGIVKLQKLGDAKDRIPPCPIALSGPTQAYDMVPKDFLENLTWRQDIYTQAAEDEKFANELWHMCRKDPWFWLNGFCWTFDPRLPLTKIPFITFDFQDDLLHELYKSLGRYDVLVEKSRDMGVSWICLAMYAHQFQFEEFQMYMIVSRKSDLVYKKDDPDTLFWKVEYLLREQPAFMDPSFDIVEMNMSSKQRQNTIKGETSTGDMGRGGRTRSTFKDEFAAFSRDDGYRALAATGDNTNNRIFNSTPQGTGNAFYDVRENPSTTRVTLHWSEDPRKNAALYTTGKKAREILGPAAPPKTLVPDHALYMFPCTPMGRELDQHELPADYVAILDHKLRSPWYDNECKRRAHPMIVAQELDIDYASSSFRFFDEKIIQFKLDNEAMTPLLRGRWKFVDEEYGGGCEWEHDDNGPWALWIPLDGFGSPPVMEDYVVSADISAGTGASNSTMTIANLRTGAKVAAFADPHITPEDFGRMAPKVAELWNQAFLIWEANGPGRQFGKKVLDGGYHNYYHAKDDGSVTNKQSDIPGWFSTDEKKFSLMSEYRDAQFQGEFCNPDEIALKECREYINLPGSKVVHSAEQNSLDPTGARSSHGDRVIADALAWKAIVHLRGPRRDKGLARKPDTPRELPPNAVGRRFKHMFPQSQEDSVKDW